MSDAYNLEEASLDVTRDDGTDVSIAGITEVTITPSVSIEQLYTGDSIKIEEQMQHSFEVGVDITVRTWDEAMAQEWLGGDGASATSMADTSKPQKFTVTGVLNNIGGTKELTVEVTGVTFEEFPLADLQMGEFQEISLSGTGEDIPQFADTTV